MVDEKCNLSCRSPKKRTSNNINVIDIVSLGPCSLLALALFQRSKQEELFFPSRRTVLTECELHLFDVLQASVP